MNSLTKLENASLLKTLRFTVMQDVVELLRNFSIIFADLISGIHFLFGKKN